MGTNGMVKSPRRSLHGCRLASTNGSGAVRREVGILAVFRRGDEGAVLATMMRAALNFRPGRLHAAEAKLLSPIPHIEHEQHRARKN